MQIFDAIAFGKAVKSKRTIEHELGLRELAELLKNKIHFSSISRIEHGSAGSADVQTVLMLCDWLGKSVCDFITIVKTKKKK